MVSTNGFSTARLDVEHWDHMVNCSLGRQNLIDELAEVLTPGVLDGLPEPLHLIEGLDPISMWIEERDAECEVLTIRVRLDGSLIGVLITAPFSEMNDQHTIHLGYLLREECWGRGYASELVVGFVDWHRALGTRGQIRGGVAQRNAASVRVMEKAGFKRLLHLTSDETEMFCLKL